MNATRIAKEIYFHAYVYHNRNTLKKMDIYKNKHVKKVVDDIIIRANPATVNNDESAVRLLAYNLLWAVK